jgi:hypothetical protein
MSSGQTFTRHTFIVPEGANRQTGPSESQVKTAYDDAVSQIKDNIRVDEGIQVWTVPMSGTYRITARGAQGGSGPAVGSGGYGATIRADFDMMEGDELYILVGQEGRSNGVTVGGGGGSFVFKSFEDSDLMVVAGGGGGYGVGNSDSHVSRSHANVDESGKSGYGNPNGNSVNVSGGDSGNGGSAARTRGCGGGGWKTDGGHAGNKSVGGGSSVKNGGYGRGGSGDGFQNGSFGGGGAVNQSSTSWGACGGGGGYSGGGGAYASSSNGVAAGGGGGSYISPDGNNVRRDGGEDGGNRSDGSVLIQYVPDDSLLGGDVDHDLEQVKDKVDMITEGVQTNQQGAAISDRLNTQMNLTKSWNQASTLGESMVTAEKANEEYKAMVYEMGQLNESRNANDYIFLGLEQELTRVSKLDQDAQSDVYKAQQRKLMLDHELQFTTFLIRIVAFTMFATALMFLPVGAYLQNAFSRAVLIFVFFVVLIGYAVVMALLFRSNSSRRKTHWNQKYHTTGKDMRKQVCKFKKNSPVVSVFSLCDFKGNRWDVKGTGIYGADDIRRNMGDAGDSISVGIKNGYSVRLLNSDGSELQKFRRNIRCMSTPGVADVTSFEVTR